MRGKTCADRVIIGTCPGSARIARFDTGYAAHAFKNTFDTPETAACKNRRLGSFGFDNSSSRRSDTDTLCCLGSADQRGGFGAASGGESKCRSKWQQAKNKLILLV